MKDETRTRDELVAELAELRRRVGELEMVQNELRKKSAHWTKRVRGGGPSATRSARRFRCLIAI